MILILILMMTMGPTRTVPSVSSAFSTKCTYVHKHFERLVNMFHGSIDEALYCSFSFQPLLENLLLHEKTQIDTHTVNVECVVVSDDRRK